MVCYLCPIFHNVISFGLVLKRRFRVRLWEVVDYFRLDAVKIVTCVDVYMCIFVSFLRVV